METTTIVIAGQELLGAVDDKHNYYIGVLELDNFLGEEKEFTRQKMRTESLKTALGADVHPADLVKKRVGRSYVNFINSRDLSRYVGWLAGQGHQQAINLLIALANEAIERRIDAGLGIANDEQKYEDNTREFYRELARKDFRPKLTDAMNGSFHSGQWGKEINLFKSAIGLPQVNVDEYDRAQMETWVTGIHQYNAFRECGLTHRNSLLKLKSKLGS